MIEKATLGGVTGWADFGRVPSSGPGPQWSGTFMFRPEHEPLIQSIAKAEGVVFQSIFDGELKQLEIEVRELGRGGVVTFSAVGEPVPRPV